MQDYGYDADKMVLTNKIQGRRKVTILNDGFDDWQLEFEWLQKNALHVGQQFHHNI